MDKRTTNICILIGWIILIPIFNAISERYRKEQQEEDFRINKETKEFSKNFVHDMQIDLLKRKEES